MCPPPKKKKNKRNFLSLCQTSGDFFWWALDPVSNSNIYCLFFVKYCLKISMQWAFVFFWVQYLANSRQVKGWFLYFTIQKNQSTPLLDEQTNTKYLTDTDITLTKTNKMLEMVGRKTNATSYLLVSSNISIKFEAFFTIKSIKYKW